MALRGMFKVEVSASQQRLIVDLPGNYHSVDVVTDNVDRRVSCLSHNGGVAPSSPRAHAAFDADCDLGDGRYGGVAVSDYTVL